MTARLSRSRAEVAAALPDITPLTYNMREVAVLLDVNYETALAMRAAGDFPSFRAGREYRVLRTAFHAALDELMKRGA